MEREELQMNDNEFDVLDELYFVQSYNDLRQMCGLDDRILIVVLANLYQKQWIRVLKSHDEDEDPKQVDLSNKYQEYFYLASKKGLLAHNTQ